MSQATLDDDDLFGEAAEEMRADVREHLDAARAALPEPAVVWEIQADNALGMLNALRSALDVEEAEAELRDAKKWYAVGERAGAFEDDDLATEIDELETLFADVRDAREAVSDLAGTLPELKATLESAAEATATAEPDADAGPEAEA